MTSVQPAWCSRSAAGLFASLLCGSLAHFTADVQVNLALPLPLGEHRIAAPQLAQELTQPAPSAPVQPEEPTALQALSSAEQTPLAEVRTAAAVQFTLVQQLI